MAKEIPASREWRLPHPIAEGGTGLEGLPPIVVLILRNRSIRTGPEVDSFLNPSQHDPSLLPGMESACRRLQQAIAGGELIGIFGDFDVDGVTGTALIAQGLGDLGGTVVPYIPHRVDEGHGLNEAALLALKEAGVSVLVTVDCGVSDVEEVALAQELGMDVVVTDHHIPPPVLPPALSIIDPKLDDSEYPFQDLSGAGLGLKLVQGLCDMVGKPWSRDLLELAALSTVADLVPLVDENRFLVREGLKELKRTRRPGLQALYGHARIRAQSLDAETIAFTIAPRLNAAGRLEHASASYGLLLSRTPEDAGKLATRLEELNRERQQLTEEAWSRAHDVVSGWRPLPPILLVDDDQVSPGIAGLVASRLVEEFHRPAVVMSHVDGSIRASARSIPEFHIADALARCGDLFRRHGGHRQAAGFEMAPENLSPLKDRLTRVSEEALGGLDPNSHIDVDAEVPVASLVGETFRWLKQLEPFGVDNRVPTFLTRGLQPVRATRVGTEGRHLRLKLKEGRVLWDAMAFRMGERWVPDTPLLDVVYTLGTDWYTGTEMLALKVLDFRSSPQS